MDDINVTDDAGGRDHGDDSPPPSPPPRLFSFVPRPDTTAVDAALQRDRQAAVMRHKLPEMVLD